MSKRLIVGSLVIAGLTAVALWSHVAAQAETLADAVTAEGETAFETAVEADAPPVTPGGETAVPVADEFGGLHREEKTEAEVPTPKTNRRQDGPRLNLIGRDQHNITTDSSHADLQARYLEFHRGIAERLTPEQLTEKCKALEKELNEIIAENEIELIQKQLSELKRKNPDHKGISTRLQRAIDALKDTSKAQGGREL
jgi:hypothetical protein